MKPIDRITYEKPEVETDKLDELSTKLFLKAKELEAANIKLKEYEIERREMTANIFHDLRAPLTALRSAIDLVKANSSTECSSENISISPELLGIMDRRTYYLETLINDMYYFSTVESPDANFNMEIIDIAPVIEEFFCEMEINDIYKNRWLNLELDDNAIYYARIDTPKFLRVLDNLCVNAAKYTHDDDSITIRVYESPYPDEDSKELYNKKRSLEDCTRHLNIDIIDTGIGISEDDLPKIYDRTYMASSSRTPDNLGTGSIHSNSGLGLSIAKVIIERMGGSLTCESTLHKGSTFHISLPITSNP